MGSFVHQVREITTSARDNIDHNPTVTFTVRFLNPGQTPVVAADQLLYFLAKQLQCRWPEYGEDKIVILFGGLHVEVI